MRAIADSIREGSDSFFFRVYGTIARLALPLSLLILALYFFREDSNKLGTFATPLVVASSFLLGALCSSLAGYVGLWASTRTNIRVAAAAADEQYLPAIIIALRGGGASTHYCSTVYIYYICMEPLSL